MENNDFEFEQTPWDIKLSNGMNITENKLFKTMNKIGLSPEPQYKISNMTVDFAFPYERVVIEVNGPHHDTEEQRKKDKKRLYVLNSLGWTRRTYGANSVHKDSRRVAKKIQKLILKKER